MHVLGTANLVWLIPGLPLAGFLFHAFLGGTIVRGMGPKAGKKLVGAIGTAVVLIAFAISVIVLLDLMKLAGERRAIVSLIPGRQDVPWIDIGTFQAHYRALIDPLSMLMCLIVTGVGGLIHLYATGYMAEDRDYPRFFTYFNLFIFFMLTLVLAENILLMFVGWEGVGLCSYLLISFWFEDVDNSKAGNKAFIVNRIGDVGFALGVMAIFATFGTLSFYGENGSGFLDMASHQLTQHGALTATAAGIIGLLLFIGATGKSAQFPLYVWLPDAMAGPTPVSALIHAATMVTAGVVMVTRVSPLLVHSPALMTLIAAVGVFTAIFAASIALTQNDIKKVLAYSTVSQLGYMFLGCGVGAFAAGMFHVTTHAFFKALLFLGAGSVIHALGGEQDMRKMGGMRKWVPITFGTMVCAWLAISGIFPLAGFWSKDAILGASTGWPTGGWVFYFVGLVTALMTAFYMTRLMVKTFWTEPRFDPAAIGAHGGHGGSNHGDTGTRGHGGQPVSQDQGTGHHGEGDEKQHAAEIGAESGLGHTGPHESPPSMWIPLVILAALSVVGGLIGIPGHNLFEQYMEPSVAQFQAHEALTPIVGGVIGTLAGLFGIFLAWGQYSKHQKTGELLTPEQKQRNPLYQGSVNLWFVDSAFYRTFVTGGGVLATFIWQGIDRFVIDGTVNLVANLVGFFSEVFRQFQTGYVRNYALAMMAGVVAVVIGLLFGAHNLLAK